MKCAYQFYLLHDADRLLECFALFLFFCLFSVILSKSNGENLIIFVLISLRQNSKKNWVFAQNSKK